MSPKLNEVLRLVADLPPDEQQALYEYLADTLPLLDRHPIQLAGTLGSPLDISEGDPIAEALEEVRRDRNSHFEAEWPA